MNIDFQSLTVAELQTLITCSKKELEGRALEKERKRITEILWNAIEKAEDSSFSIYFQDNKRTITIEDLTEMSLYIQ